MSIIAPSTTVTLYHDVPITDEKNLIFKNISNQRSYFAGKVYRTSVECSYERAGAPLMLDIPISDMYRFNYISFKNEAFENKEIYARPLPPVYINNEVLAVPYVIDYWQTFMFDVKMDKCGILRQHPTVGEENDYDGTPYGRFHAFLTPEPLSYSDAIRNQRNTGDTIYLPIMRGNPWGIGLNEKGRHTPVLAVMTTQYLDDVDEKVKTNKPQYDGNTNFPSAVVAKFFSCDNDGLTAMQTYINLFTEHDMVSSILGIYYIPAIMMKATDATSINEGSGHEITPPLVSWNIVEDHVIGLPTWAGVDKKLLHYPYMYIRITDYLGNSKEYKIDRFNDVSHGEVTFGLFFTMNGYPQVVLAPKNYMGTYNNNGSYDSSLNAYNFEEKMVVTDFPQVGYNTDGYLAWLGGVFRQQSIKDVTAAPWAYNPVIDTASAAMKTTGSAVGGAVKSGATGNPAGAISGVGSGIADLGNTVWNQNLERTQHQYAEQFYENPLSKEVAVPQYMADAIPMFAKDDYHAGGSTCGLPACMFDKLGFLVEIVSLLPEETEVYNEFLDKYGYTQNRIDTPAVCKYVNNGSSDDLPTYNTENLTFVKTSEMSVEGANIEVTSAIEQMFNGGHWFAKGDS